jgi:hypothetical protein
MLFKLKNGTLVNLNNVAHIEKNDFEEESWIVHFNYMGSISTQIYNQYLKIDQDDYNQISNSISKKLIYLVNKGE